MCGAMRKNQDAGKIKDNQFYKLYKIIEAKQKSLKTEHCKNAICLNKYVAKENITAASIDFTLSSVIFIHVMHCDNKPQVKDAVESLRSLRNEVVHLSPEELKGYDFCTTWNKIENELKVINGYLPPSFVNSIQDKIEKIQSTTSRCDKCCAMISEKTLKCFSGVSCVSFNILPF